MIRTAGWKTGAALVLCLLLGCGGVGKPVTQHQRKANEAKWESRPKAIDLFDCVVRYLSDYQAQIVFPKNSRGSDLKVSVTDEGENVFSSVRAHRGTVFTRRGHVLYWAEYSQFCTGCTVMAYDLKARTESWKTDLKGIGPVPHSKYSNRVTIAEDGDTIVVWGNESSGHYIEILDAETGKTVGHRVFPAMQ